MNVDLLRRKLQNSQNEEISNTLLTERRLLQRFGTVTSRTNRGWVVTRMDGSQVVDPIRHSSRPLAVGVAADVTLRDGFASIDF